MAVGGIGVGVAGSGVGVGTPGGSGVGVAAGIGVAVGGTDVGVGSPLPQAINASPATITRVVARKPRCISFMDPLLWIDFGIVGSLCSTYR